MATVVAMRVDAPNHYSICIAPDDLVGGGSGRAESRAASWIAWRVARGEVWIDVGAQRRGVVWEGPQACAYNLPVVLA